MAVLAFLIVAAVVAVGVYDGLGSALLLLLGLALAGLVVEVLIPNLVANRDWIAWQLTGTRRAMPAPRAPQPPRRRRGAAAWEPEAARLLALDNAHAGPPAPARAREQVRDLDGEIARAGWDVWAGMHALRVVDVVADPGNPGADLTLFEVAAGTWRGVRIVQVIDASPDHRGIRERHGIPVPTGCRTALDAVAATWGLDPAAYRPQRHT